MVEGQTHTVCHRRVIRMDQIGTKPIEKKTDYFEDLVSYANKHAHRKAKKILEQEPAAIKQFDIPDDLLKNETHRSFTKWTDQIDGNYYQG